MSVSPNLAPRLNNLNERSRSPSPAANPILHIQPQNSNFDLIRNHRSIPIDPIIQEDRRLPEAIPLIDATPNPPLANPELDDMDDDDRETASAPHSDVDETFLLFDRAGEIGPTITESGDEPDGRRIFPASNPASRPLSPALSGFPEKRFHDFELGTIADLESIPDVNVYQHKKTLAQGMMDLALFSANANQLRYVFENDQHPYYYPGVVLICFSLILQVAIGVGLIWNSRYNVKDEKQICIANKINNFTVIGIFLVTVVNVFISAFGVASVQPAARAAANP